MPLHAWQVPGADVPGRHTLDAPAESAAHVSLAPHAMLGHAVQKPPMPLPAQHPRQNDSELVELSRVHTLQPLHTSETVRWSASSGQDLMLNCTSLTHRIRKMILN